MAKKRTSKNTSKITKRSNMKRWQILLGITLIAIAGIVVVYISNAAAPSKSVKDFGAVGDGVADDTAAIQNAIDTVSASGVAANQAQELRLPAGTYKITRPLLMKSFVQFRGAPGQTIILQGSTRQGEKSHIILGDAHPWAFNPANDLPDLKRTFTNMNATYIPNGNKPRPQDKIWPRGANTITLDNPEDAARLKVGEIVCVRSTVGLPFGDAIQPDFVQFTKIVKINGNKLEFADRSLNKIEDPQVCKIEGRDPHITNVTGQNTDWYAAQWVEVSGITFRGGDLGIDRGLCYSCFIKQVNFEDLITPMAVNAMVKTIFSDINASYGGRGLEVKMASSKSTFKNINLKYRPGPCPSPAQGTDCNPPNFNAVWPIDTGERSENIVFENIKVDDRGSRRNKAIYSIGDARDVTLRNSNITVDGGANREAVLEIRGNYYLGYDYQKYPTENFIFKDNSFTMLTPSTQLALLGDKLKRTGPQFQINNIVFTNNSWRGASTTSGIAYRALNQVTNWSINGDKFNGTASSIIAESGSQPPRESGIQY